MANGEESGLEFLDRWALIVLRHKFFYLLLVILVVGGYTAKEMLTARPCRTSWLIRSSEDPAAMQAVSAALGISAQIKKYGSALAQITVWGPREMCGLATVVRVVAALRKHFDGAIGDTVGEPISDYNHRRAGPVVGRAVLAAFAIVGVFAVVVDTGQRAWRHVLALSKIANGEE